MVLNTQRAYDSLAQEYKRQADAARHPVVANDIAGDAFARADAYAENAADEAFRASYVGRCIRVGRALPHIGLAVGLTLGNRLGIWHTVASVIKTMRLAPLNIAQANIRAAWNKPSILQPFLVESVVLGTLLVATHYLKPFIPRGDCPSWQQRIKRVALRAFEVAAYTGIVFSPLTAVGAGLTYALTREFLDKPKPIARDRVVVE